mgnify:FL=1
MAGQRGFLYEKSIFNKLKGKGITPSGSKPAGANPNLPDAVFIYQGQPYNLEVKLDLRTDFGQGTLNYTDGIWTLGGASTSEAEEMRRLLSSVGAAQFANAEWGKKGAPNKGSVQTSDFTQEMVREDYYRFKDGFKIVDKRNVWDYYAAKNTYYIQIGGYGLYYMSANPANLPIKQLDVSTRLRIRLKRGGSYPINNYRFTTALQVTQKPSSSPIDIDRNIDQLVA